MELKEAKPPKISVRKRPLSWGLRQGFCRWGCNRANFPLALGLRWGNGRITLILRDLLSM